MGRVVATGLGEAARFAHRRFRVVFRMVAGRLPFMVAAIPIAIAGGPWSAALARSASTSPSHA